MARKKTGGKKAPTKPETSYRWRPDYKGSRKVKAEIVHKELEAIARANAGAVRAAEVVDRARPEDARLHPLFTWDDRLAAEAYRREEARDVINGVQPVIVEMDTGRSVPTSPQCFVHCGGRDSDAPSYRQIEAVRESPELRRQAVLNVLAQMRAMAQRYEELAGVLGTLQDIERAIREAAA